MFYKEVHKTLVDDYNKLKELPNYSVHDGFRMEVGYKLIISNPKNTKTHFKHVALGDCTITQAYLQV